MKTSDPKLKVGQVWKDRSGDLSYIAEIREDVCEEDEIMGDVSIIVLTGPKAGKYYPEETSASFGEGSYFVQQVA